jgi:O-antigen ligase
MLMAIPLAVGLLSAFVSRGMQGVKPTLRDRLVWLASADASRTTLLGFAILTMALALVMTMSRSGMIALSAAFAIAAVTMSRRQSGAGRQVAVTGYLAAVTLLVVWWVGTDVIVTRFGSADALSISQRPAIWRDTVAIARDFWLTGTGLNTYGVSTLYYQTSVPDLHLNEAHNDYLQLAAEGGLLLGIPILLTIGAFVWHVRQRFREDVGSTWWVRMGAVTGILAVAVQSLAEFSLQRAGNAALFAVLCGIALHDGRPREHGSAVGVGRQRGVRENETDTACRPLVNGAALCA